MNTPRYVILVEDDPTVLHSLRLQIRQILPSHYHIEIANDGEEALEVLQEINEENGLVPLIVTDYQMPKMTGCDFLIAVKQQVPKCRNIMLTGEAGLSDVTRLINEQALFRYLTKPWNQSDLEMTILSALESFNQEYKLEKLNYELAETNANLEKTVMHRTQELEQKTAQLESGLSFASLMQRNLLPSRSEMNAFFPTLDLLFKAHTSVSGDFYAFSKLGNEQAYLVIGDCTGHGVAGAFLSNICLATLNSYFNNNQVYTPKQVLFEVLQQIRKLSEKAEHSMSSMISVELSVLCVNKSDRTMTGATNSKQLIFFKNKQEYKPACIPFECCRGNNNDGDKLKNRGKEMVIPFDEADTVLLYTDGISDQFTPTGKKIYRKGIIRSLTEIENIGAEKWFDHEKGETEQIDDASLILISVPK